MSSKREDVNKIPVDTWISELERYDIELVTMPTGTRWWACLLGTLNVGDILVCIYFRKELPKYMSTLKNVSQCEERRGEWLVEAGREECWQLTGRNLQWIYPGQCLHMVLKNLTRHDNMRADDKMDQPRQERPRRWGSQCNDAAPEFDLWQWKCELWLFGIARKLMWNTIRTVTHFFVISLK